MQQHPTPAQGAGHVAYALVSPSRHIPTTSEHPRLSPTGGALLTFLHFRAQEGIAPCPLRLILADTSVPAEELRHAIVELIAAGLIREAPDTEHTSPLRTPPMDEGRNVLHVVRTHPRITHIDATPLLDDRLSLVAKGLYATLYVLQEFDPERPLAQDDDTVRAAWGELVRCGYAGRGAS